MKLIKLIFNGCVIGISIGFIIALFFSLVAGSSQFEPSAPVFTSKFTSNVSATMVSLFLWVLMGLIFQFSSLIFKAERWSITKQSIIHFLITYSSLTALGTIAGWFQFIPLISYTITFIIIYLVIWIISMKVAKQRVDQINHLIK
ncbi:DUF3021 domain-containing protein [Lactobacillus sp. Sy-1]|uniref:DUF3021 domain-containing protein n=1 Tax=Lactobacillus sp. Sy-1 TaxID=2109645 RepID=UPI001C585E20|nr:DUF3021 domain-containing protein [Lactobacillus sp. Sy-1]MBW1605006.1 DUF3021 domain-containing protein [Lactobacillus sp. Sy-1]